MDVYGDSMKVYRDHKLPLPKLILESYRNLANAFLVSFEDYNAFVHALEGFDLDMQPHTVVAIKDVQKGQLYYVNENGDVLRYKLNDFIYTADESFIDDGEV